MSALKYLLFYAGVDKESYEMVEPTIIKQNRITVQATSVVAVLLIAAMYAVSYIVEELSINREIYEAGVIISALIFVLAAELAKRMHEATMPLVYFSYSAYYIYAILISTLTGRDSKTFMVMLVFLPILFVGKPIKFILLTVAYIGIFIALCFNTKTGFALCVDVADAICFGILGMVTGTASTAFKVNGYVQSKRLASANAKWMGLSHFDTLTGMRNRNAYEEDIKNIASECQEALGCIYIDVNGLKHINDSKGHEEGDRMLKFVANEIQKYFGSDYTYRIGGDEFVVFVPDPELYEIKTKTDKILEEIQPRSYYAAIGWKVHDLEGLSMKDLVTDAESFMYEKKGRFYEQSEFNRRKPKEPNLDSQSLQKIQDLQDLQNPQDLQDKPND